VNQHPDRESTSAPLTLEGKVAIVTGAGSRSEGIGTGRAAAIVLARHGARVLAVDRDLGAAEHTAELAESAVGEVVPHTADITNADDCRRMVDAAVQRWERVDILDNNVGLEGPGTVLDADWTNWDRLMALNVRSVAMCSAAVIPHMQSGSAIVNIASIAAWRPHGITPYSTSKGAVIALTRSMALDHAAAGIRVNCVAPGPIYTPMVAAGMSVDLRHKRSAASPLRSEGTAWDIASAVRYLVSDEARWVTGVVLPVDGGVSLCSPDR
jgi:NAD(P)-dependent dehydrogenase (short-subunit alcohol dehydrogenase family)